jgi:hypothetical protein
MHPHHRMTMAMLACTVALALPASRTVAQPPRGEAPTTLAGAWRVNLLGLGPGAVPILMTFNRDGTLLQTDTPVLLPQPVPPSSAASNGHGLWRQTGARDFAFTYVKIFYGPEGPAVATVTQRGQAMLSADGKSFNASLVGTDFVDANGNPINTGAVSSITFNGTRIAAP